MTAVVSAEPIAATVAQVVGEGPEGIGWGVCLADGTTGTVLAEHRSHELFPTASVGKVLLLLEVARALEHGGLGARELLGPLPEDEVADSGLWHHLRVERLPAEDLAALVGAVSDNLATNVLLRRVGGLRAIDDLAELHGIRHVTLHDRVRDVRGPGDPPALSTATPAALVDLVLRLEHGELVSSGVCDRVTGWLALDTDLSMVASAFGLDPLAHSVPDRGVRLWNKTGTVPGTRADTGLVGVRQRRVAFAVVACWDDASAPASRDVVLGGMRRIGESVVTALRA